MGSGAAGPQRRGDEGPVRPERVPAQRGPDGPEPAPGTIIIQQQQGGFPSGPPTKGIIALVLALLALLTLWSIVPPLVLGTGALVLGLLQLQEGGEGPGQTMAIIGVVVGALALLAVFIILLTPVQPAVGSEGSGEPEGSGGGHDGGSNAGGGGSGSGGGSGGSGSGGGQGGGSGAGGGGSGGQADPRGGSGGGPGGGGAGGGGSGVADVESPAPGWLVLNALLLGRGLSVSATPSQRPGARWPRPGHPPSAPPLGGHRRAPAHAPGPDRSAPRPTPGATPSRRCASSPAPASPRGAR